MLEPIVKRKASNKTAKAQRRVLLDRKLLQRSQSLDNHQYPMQNLWTVWKSFTPKTIMSSQRRNLFPMQSKRPFWSSVLIDNSSRDYRLTARCNSDRLFRWRSVLRHSLFASSKQKWEQAVEYRSAS